MPEHAADLIALVDSWRAQESAPRQGWDFSALFLARFAGVLPPDTVATEGWPPNLPVAAARLAAHGVDVVPYDSEAVPAKPMPFPDGRFDLVLNRHESSMRRKWPESSGPGGVPDSAGRRRRLRRSARDLRHAPAVP